MGKQLGVSHTGKLGHHTYVLEYFSLDCTHKNFSDNDMLAMRLSLTRNQQHTLLRGVFVFFFFCLVQISASVLNRVSPHVASIYYEKI